MSKTLSKLIATLTRKSRYIPEFEWCANNWTYNIFRLYEHIFGKAYGKNGVGDTIRCEARTFDYYDKGLKERVTLREFYTAEALIAHCESVIRKFFTMPEFGFKFVPLPQMVTTNGMPMSPFPPIFSFAIAYDADQGVQYTGSATSTTLSHTVTGSNPFIVNITNQAQQRTVDSFTWNGVGMTRTDTDVTFTGMQMTTTILPNCDTGTHDAVMTCTGGNAEWVHSVISYSGCASTGQPDAHTTATATSTSPTATVTTVAANAVGFSYTRLKATGTTALTASTNVNNVRSIYQTYYGGVGDSNAKASPGSFTMTWTSQNVEWGVMMFSIAPYVVPTPSPSLSDTVTISENANISQAWNIPPSFNSGYILGGKIIG